MRSARGCLPGSREIVLRTDTPPLEPSSCDSRLHASSCAYQKTPSHCCSTTKVNAEFRHSKMAKQQQNQKNNLKKSQSFLYLCVPS
eukprot:56373-Amphidinium_carterae.1